MSISTRCCSAMASGLAVVGSAVGGLKDYIVDGSNGLLVPAQDPAALAAAIQRLVDEDALRARLASAARETAMQFDERVVLERFGALLDRLAEAS